MQNELRLQNAIEIHINHHISNEFTMVNIFHSRITTWLLFQPRYKLFFSEADSLYSSIISIGYHKMSTGRRYIHYINHFMCEFHQLKFTQFLIQFPRLESR